MIRVYEKADKVRVEYDYDAGGNRVEKRQIIGLQKKESYEYYKDSNRLKKLIDEWTGEETAYVYDANGNLIKKGNCFKENLDGSIEIEDKGEYYEYHYTVKNRLKEVYRIGELIGKFEYDIDGNRISSDTKDESQINYIFSYGGRVLFEEHITDTKKINYIYAINRQIAKVEGILGSEVETTYYHHDNLGSTRMMTDEEGNIKYEQDYLPFGEDIYESELGGYKFTGQREVAGIGLYYYGARYYDPEIGRFITEDTYQGDLGNPISQNQFIYVLQNPLKYVDPTGHYSIDAINEDMTCITVEEGDIFSQISYDFYGDVEFIDLLALINGIEDINKINIGQQLIIPNMNLDVDGAQNDLVSISTASGQNFTIPTLGGNQKLVTDVTSAFMGAISEVIKKEIHFGIEETWAAPKIYTLVKGKEVSKYIVPGKISTGITILSAGLDIANTWTANNSNTKAQRLEKTGVIVAGTSLSYFGGAAAGMKGAEIGGGIGLSIGGPIGGAIGGVIGFAAGSLVTGWVISAGQDKYYDIRGIE